MDLVEALAIIALFSSPRQRFSTRKEHDLYEQAHKLVKQEGEKVLSRLTEMRAA